MEIKRVEGEDDECTEGFVVEMLGEVEFRPTRHEACEAAMAILERVVDDLRNQIASLRAEQDTLPPGKPD
jgi:hypothetical protein